MTDPYRPRPGQQSRPRTGGTGDRELRSFLRRLAVAGATADEIAEVAAAWDDWPEDAMMDRATLVALPHLRLVEMVQASRAEAEFGTLDADEHEVALRATVDRVLTGTVAEVMAWVAGDPLRAAVAADAERASGDERVTLLRQLDALTSGDGT